MGHPRTEESDSDLHDIWYYVASKSGSIEIADRLIDPITDRFLLLAPYPNAGCLRTDLHSGLRSFPVGEYVIIYRISDDGILILRVLRGSRNLKDLFGH